MVISPRCFGFEGLVGHFAVDHEPGEIEAPGDAVLAMVWRPIVQPIHRVTAASMACWIVALEASLLRTPSASGVRYCRRNSLTT